MKIGLSRHLCVAAVAVGSVVAAVMAVPARAPGAEATPCIERSGTGPRLGLLLTHIGVGAETDEQCRRSGKATNLSERDQVIASYQSPHTRMATRTILKEAASAGIEAVRTVLWFRPGGTTASTVADQRLGTFRTENGRLAELAINNLHAYAADVRAAGMRRFLLVFGAQGNGDPTCRIATWGDCYDPATAETKLRIIRQVSGALADLSDQRFQIEYDVSPEACGALRPQTLAQSSANAFDRLVLAGLRDLFTSHHAYISCNAAAVKVGLAGIEAISRAYLSAGLRPTVLDAHIYVTDRAKLVPLLQAAEQAAVSLGVPFDIQETPVNNRDLFALIAEMSRAGQLARLRYLILWPKEAASECAINFTPEQAIPYTRQLYCSAR